MPLRSTLACLAAPPCGPASPPTLPAPHLQPFRVQCPRVLQLRRHGVVCLPPERWRRPRRCPLLLLLKWRARRRAVAIAAGGRRRVQPAAAQLPLKLALHCRQVWCVAIDGLSKHSQARKHRGVHRIAAQAGAAAALPSCAARPDRGPGGLHDRSHHHPLPQRPPAVPNAVLVDTARPLTFSIALTLVAALGPCRRNPAAWQGRATPPGLLRRPEGRWAEPSGAL